jgi:hypothetical protein
LPAELEFQDGREQEKGKKKQEETFRIQIEIFLKKMCRGINKYQ